MTYEITPDECNDDEVIIAAGDTDNAVYHTTVCARYPSRPRKMDREMAEAWGRRECRYCGDDRPTASNPDYSYQRALREATND